MQLRVYKKNPSFEREQLNDIDVSLSDDEINYKTIYENIKNYLVFRISTSVNFKDHLAYLDVLDYVERIHLEANKIKERG